MLFISGIPSNLDDIFLERIFRCYGNVKLWRRVYDNQYMSFCFVEFIDSSSVINCLNNLNGQIIGKSNVCVIPDKSVLIKEHKFTKIGINHILEIYENDILEMEMSTEYIKYKYKLDLMLKYKVNIFEYNLLWYNNNGCKSIDEWNSLLELKKCKLLDYYSKYIDNVTCDEFYTNRQSWRFKRGMSKKYRF